MTAASQAADVGQQPDVEEARTALPRRPQRELGQPHLDVRLPAPRITIRQHLL